MAGNINFIEIAPDEECYYCGRRKIAENERFYRVLVGGSPLDIVVCELCKGGFSGRILESAIKSYASHFTFYVKRSLLEQENKLSKETFDELICSIENYESGDYSACFRGIGLVAERITNKLYAEKFEELTAADKISWENKLIKLLDAARKTCDIPGEAAIYQLSCVKLFRNNADHASEYQITAEDARLGLASIAYLIQWKLQS